MTKASDNEYPSLLVKEGTAPASPAAGDQRLFIDSADHLLKRKNSGGTVTTVGGGIADQGAFTYLDGTDAAAPGNPSAGSHRLYSKTGGLYYRDSAGTEVGPLAAGGAGSDLVQVATGAGSVVIPGLKGSPDAVPGSPSAYNDEFNAFSGWTTLGALDTLNVTDFPSNVHMVKNTSASQLDGIYKACPSTPFTVTAKFTDFLFGQNYQAYGLMIGDGTPTAWMTAGYYSVGQGAVYRGLYNWSSRTSRGATGESQASGFMHYIRLVVTSGSSIALWASQDGLIWSLIAGSWDSGLTPGYVGVFVSSMGPSVPMEAAVDWIRFS